MELYLPSSLFEPTNRDAVKEKSLLVFAIIISTTQSGERLNLPTIDRNIKNNNKSIAESLQVHTTKMK